MYSSMSVTTVVVSVVLPFLAVAAVGLRLVAQHRNPKRFTADEMVVVLNCVILIGSGCLLIVGACVGGIGADLRHVSPGTVVSFRKIAFVSEFFYITTVRLVKVSLLLYYRRIFVLPAFRRVSNAVLGLVAVWMLAFIITTIVQARPISWNWTEKGQHVDLHSFFISEAVTNIALDVLLLCMPSFVVKGLHMSFKKKFAVVSILALGSFCVVASAIRLYYVTKYFTVSVKTDLYRFASTVTNLDLWSLIEPCSSTVCICLPCLGPIFKGGRTPASLVNSVRSIFSVRSNESLRGTKERESSFSDSNRPSKSWESSRGLQPRDPAVGSVATMTTTIEHGQAGTTEDKLCGGIKVQSTYSSESTNQNLSAV